MYMILDNSTHKMISPSLDNEFLSHTGYFVFVQSDQSCFFFMPQWEVAELTAYWLSGDLRTAPADTPSKGVLKLIGDDVWKHLVRLWDCKLDSNLGDMNGFNGRYVPWENNRGEAYGYIPTKNWRDIAPRFSGEGT